MNKKAHIEKKHLSFEDKVFQSVVYAFCILFGLICLYPFYYLLICTISNTQLVDMGKIILWPQDVHFNNYIEVFKVQNLGRAAFISFSRSLFGSGLTLIASSYMAYFFTKQEMWMRKFWYRVTVITMYFSAGMIPSYLNNQMLGLVNTFWIYVIPGMISVYNMILIKTSMESLPAELEESAWLDGAGYLRRFIRIILPLQVPILATIVLFSAVSHWNDYFTTKLYVTDTKLYTLQFLLYELLNQIQAASQQIQFESSLQQVSNQVAPTGIRMTLTAVVVIPILIIYPFVQRFYVKGIMVGAIKG